MQIKLEIAFLLSLLPLLFKAVRCIQDGGERTQDLLLSAS